MTKKEKQNEFYLKQLHQLVGGKIIGLAEDPKHEFFGLVVRNRGEQSICWFLMDDEGNGPGSFEIEKIPTLPKDPRLN